MREGQVLERGAGRKKTATALHGIAIVVVALFSAGAVDAFAETEANSLLTLAERLQAERPAAPAEEPGALPAPTPGGHLFVIADRAPDDARESVVNTPWVPHKAGAVEIDLDAPLQLAQLREAASAPAGSQAGAGDVPMREEDLRALSKRPAGESESTQAERFVEAVRAEKIEKDAPPAPSHARADAEREPIVVADASGAKSVEAHEERGDMFTHAPRLAENPRAKSTFERVGSRDGIMRVLAGKSLIIDLQRTAKRVSVANPEVAEVLVISPRQVMVNGLANGETSIIIWDTSGNYKMYTLVVGDQLQDQVMLEVTVAEINRTAAERHGVDVRALGGQFGTVTQFGNAAPTGGTFPAKAGEPVFPFGLDSGISWAVVDFKNDIAAFFEQIQREDLGRVLAEPKLLARSGKEANFLSGGEIPIVITQNDDTTIEFKEFGTKIEFVPAVREDGTIDLNVKSEVSEPDFSSGVELFGFRVPAFVTRRVDTDVTLRDGESLVIAGLIKETKQELESKLPFMGDIPFLGYFFRSTEFEKNLLELVIVVRPKIVAPIAAGERVPLPTDRGPLTRGEVRTQPEAEKVSRPRPY